MKIYRLCSFNGYVTSGSYFVYKGEKYGEFTEVRFTDEFYKENIRPVNMTAAEILGHGYAKTRNFVSVGTKNGKKYISLETTNNLGPARNTSILFQIETLKRLFDLPTI